MYVSVSVKLRVYRFCSLVCAQRDPRRRQGKKGEVQSSTSSLAVGVWATFDSQSFDHSNGDQTNIIVATSREQGMIQSFHFFIHSIFSHATQKCNAVRTVVEYYK